MPARLRYNDDLLPCHAFAGRIMVKTARQHKISVRRGISSKDTLLLSTQQGILDGTASSAEARATGDAIVEFRGGEVHGSVNCGGLGSTGEST